MIDFYSLLGEIIRAQHGNHDINAALSDKIIRGVTDELATQHGGQTVYLRNLYSERAAVLGKKIAEEYSGGATLTALSRKYRRSCSWIKKCIKKAEDVGE